MTISRRALVAGLVASGGASAQGFPNRPIRLIVGFAPGGSADAVARVLAPELSRLLGQPVVVENRTGASGVLGTTALLQAPADGHTLGFAGLQIATNPAMLGPSGGANYDTAELTMISQVTALPVLVMASTKSGITSLPQLLEAARAKGEGLTAASGGYGTTSHLGPEMLFRSVGAKVTVVVYRGGGPALQGLIAGETDMMFDIAASGHRPAIESGLIRALAVLQPTRAPELPDVPAVAEFGLGPDVQMRSWQGIMVRTGTPEPIRATLHKAVVAAVRDGGTDERLRRMGMEPLASDSAAEFQRLYLSELERWGTLIRDAGIKAQ